MAKRRVAAKKAPAKKAATRKGSVKKAPTIKKDPLAEYQAAMNARGIARISTLAQDECVSNVTGRVSTGSLALDRALTNPGEPRAWGGGIPLSRVTEVYGAPYIGKSTLLDQIGAAVQRMGGVYVLADTEISRDKHYTGDRLHVDVEKLQYVDFETPAIEHVLQAVAESAEWWTKHYPDTPVVIGWDALAGTATLDELAKGFVSEKAHEPAAAARAMARAARLIAPKLKGTKVALVILNHQYQIVGARPGQKQKEAYGGDGTRHLTSLRIQLYHGGWVKLADGTILGHECVAKLVKNRLGDAWVEIPMAMLHGFGVDNVWTLHQDLMAAKVAVPTSAGSTWVVVNLDGEEVKWQGYPGLRRKIAEVPDLYGKLVSVWTQLGR